MEDATTTTTTQLPSTTATPGGMTTTIRRPTQLPVLPPGQPTAEQPPRGFTWPQLPRQSPQWPQIPKIPQRPYIPPSQPWTPSQAWVPPATKAHTGCKTRYSSSRSTYGGSIVVVRNRNARARQVRRPVVYVKSNNSNYSMRRSPSTAYRPRTMTANKRATGGNWQLRARKD